MEEGPIDDDDVSAPPPHDIRRGSDWSDTPTLFNPARPESPLAGVFGDLSNASTDSVDSLVGPAEYYPKLVEPECDSDEEDIGASVTIKPSRTPAPFPVYNVFVCSPSTEFGGARRIRRRSV